LDGSLPDGSRIQASLAEDVTTKGPTFSIRKFTAEPLSPIHLIKLKTVSVDVMAYLWFCIESGVSMLICGGTATGKTTMLNAISLFIPPEYKIVSIEDTRELQLPHENWIPSVTRMGFGAMETSGKRYGEVTMFDLLKESFRQNPDYVVVGEVRGREAYVMFQGMASGHPSMGTIHAGSVDDVMKRLETPPIEISPSLIESLDLLIVLTNAKEKGKSARRVKEMVEIQSVDSRTGIAHTRESFSWIPSDDIFRENIMESDLLRKISFQEGMTYQKLMQELENRERVLEWMRKHKIFQFDEVCRIINLYYKDRETLMGWVDKDLSPDVSKRKTVVKKAWKPEEVKKPKHPPISHKPDLSYKPSKPKIELKEILSKVKTKPFRMPKPERFLKPEAKKPSKPEKPKVSKPKVAKPRAPKKLKTKKPRIRKIKSKATTS
ncbi:MAG: type II/IV secretion system ATPase subunit, partial [Candidatus Aenigmarchaeota archaeon]|nr:type II/IV secretion system ATPase subunit [Candidatus Aenigmarchaeota archaeon]